MARTTVYWAQVVFERLAQRGSSHVRVRRVRRLAADEARKLQQSIKTHSSIAFKRITALATREIDLIHTRMLLAASETRMQHKQSFYSRSGIDRRHCRAQAEKVFNFRCLFRPAPKRRCLSSRPQL